MNKENIRKTIAKTILLQVKDEKAKLNLCTNLHSLEAYTKAHTVLSFISLDDEIATDEIHISIMNSAKKLALPRIFNNTMDFYYIKKNISLEDQIETGTYNIAEPKKHLSLLPKTNIDNSCIILVPGRAFTIDGKRLGRGKGFYDSYFMNFFYDLLHKKPYFVGLCYDCQIVPNIPCEKHDIVMDCVITEKNIFIR